MSAVVHVAGGAARNPTSLASLRQAYSKPVVREAEPEAAPSKEDDVTPNDVDDGPGEEEWAEIEARTEEIREKEVAERGKIRAQDDLACRPMTYQELEQWLREVDVDDATMEQFNHEVSDDVGCMCMSRRRIASEVRGLDRRQWKGKDLILFLKVTDFDFNNIPHFRMLRTAYLKLSRNKTCPAIGRHWEVLGFQHTDPRTDLNRSGGVLNVLHFFYFFANYFDILKAAYLLAQDTEQNFPLACVSINLTRMTIDCLLRGLLSRLCNKDPKGVMHATCEVYAGAVFLFYHNWKIHKRTIVDTERTFKEVRYLMEKQPHKLVEGLALGEKERKAKTDSSRFEFTDLDFTKRAAATKPPPQQQAQRGPALPDRMKQYQGKDD